ncbi:hypothetical protein ACFV2Q_27545 [Streptomyces sp. NPDC059650]|uniref:hypothetical protein n=1 Tax=Streptomyces sp. NPDC059650 TaxID=3346896 RepID=UPI0036CE80FA
MTTEAAVDIIAVIPEPAPTPPLEVVPDLPTAPVAEIAAGITNALVAAWSAIRARNSEVPEAIVTMATGGRESAVKLAHFARDRWKMREGDDTHHEVFVTAEALRDGAEAVIATLVHEAAHGLSVARGIDDCSISQYHNKHFKKASEELGLVQKANTTAYEKKKYGFAFTTLGEEAKVAYADQIAALDEAIRATRTPTYIPTRTRGGGKDGTTGPTKVVLDDTEGVDGGEEIPPRPEKEDRNYVKATCQCSPVTVIRVSPKSLARRRILCGECMQDFTMPESTG